jgi:hypothetical protein
MPLNIPIAPTISSVYASGFTVSLGNASDGFQIDTFTYTGSNVFILSQTPLPDSEDITINGLMQPASEYTIVGNVLTILGPLSLAFGGDQVQAQYETLVENTDGNPEATTFYCFRLVTGVTTKYLNNVGQPDSIQTWQHIRSLGANALQPNTLYTVDLSAADDAIGTNATGFGPGASAVTLAAVPISPVFSSVFSTTMMATWGSINPVGTEFDVQVSTDPTFTTGVIDSGWITDIGFIFTNLLPSSVYYGRVRARNSNSINSAWVLISPATTTAGPAVIHTLDVQNLLADRGFLLSWAPGLETNLVGYNVYRSPSPTDNSSYELLSASKPSCPITTRNWIDKVPYSFGITFYYKVTAMDDQGNESSLFLTTPCHDNSFHSFDEQPFFQQVQLNTPVIDEAVVGTPNNILVTFSTAAAYKAGTLAVYLNGARQIRGDDFNEGPTQTQFTFTDPPDAGGTIRVDYIRLI